LATKILHGEYVAQFYVSRDVPPVYHAVITKQDSAQIVSWCQCRSASECEENATATMRSITGRKDNNLLLFPPIQQSKLRRIAKKKKAKRQSA
jgi:hypothetical protein